MTKLNILERNLRLLDLFFVPSSLLRIKKDIEKDLNKKTSNWWYIPLITLESGRIAFYSYYLSKYI
jgi:hypothetical protein